MRKNYFMFLDWLWAKIQEVHADGGCGLEVESKLIQTSKRLEIVVGAK